MPEHVSCPRCGCACRVQPHDHANCVQCFTSFRPSQAHEPQVEVLPLFTPAPAVMPGQTTMGA